MWRSSARTTSKVPAASMRRRTLPQNLRQYRVSQDYTIWSQRAQASSFSLFRSLRGRYKNSTAPGLLFTKGIASLVLLSTSLTFLWALRVITSLERLPVSIRLGRRELVGREGKRCLSTLSWKSKHASSLNLCNSLGWLHGSGYPEIRSRYEHLPLEPFLEYPWWKTSLMPSNTGKKK